MYYLIAEWECTICLCVWARDRGSVKIPSKFHSSSSQPVSPLQGRVNSGSAHFRSSQMIGGSVCGHGWMARCDKKPHWRRLEFRGGVTGDRGLEEGDVTLWLIWVRAGHSQVDGRREEGVKVLLVCYIGFVALTMIIISKRRVWQIILMLQSENIIFILYFISMDEIYFYSWAVLHSACPH